MAATTNISTSLSFHDPIDPVLNRNLMCERHLDTNFVVATFRSETLRYGAYTRGSNLRKVDSMYCSQEVLERGSVPVMHVIMCK
jgi:hypothetical protein